MDSYVAGMLHGLRLACMSIGNPSDWNDPATALAVLKEIQAHIAQTEAATIQR